MRATARLALAALLAAPLLVALTDRHLAGAPAALVASTATGALAVSALVLQPLLAARVRALGRPRIAWHRALGVAALVLVIAHVGGLFLVGGRRHAVRPLPRWPDPRADGAPGHAGARRARPAHRRLPIADTSWRTLHAFLAGLVVVLGVGHAVLTDGALDGAGTPLLLGLGAAAFVGVVAVHAQHARARNRRNHR